MQQPTGAALSSSIGDGGRDFSCLRHRLLFPIFEAVALNQIEYFYSMMMGLARNYVSM